MKLRGGTMVTEEVKLLDLLEGAPSGRVWLADQLDWRKKVVVKALEGLKPKDDAALERFLEAAAQAQELDSERVARIFDFGVTDDFTPYVVMELLKGETLTARLRKTDRLEPKEVGEVVSQLSEVIETAQLIELWHLGLSPDMLMLEDGRGGLVVKVLGYGTACVAKPDRGSAYLSPEQYLGKAVDGRADLWSLGAITYAMLTGQTPIDAQKRRLMQWDFEPPSEMWLTDVPPEVDAWFDKALHKDPDKRFASANEMSTAFAALMPGLEHLSGQPTQGTGVIKVVDVGTPSEPKATSSGVVIDVMTDVSPGIVIDMDD
jgi:serine/threonine protein kinase